MSLEFKTPFELRFNSRYGWRNGEPCSRMDNNGFEWILRDSRGFDDYGEVLRRTMNELMSTGKHIQLRGSIPLHFLFAHQHGFTPNKIPTRLINVNRADLIAESVQSRAAKTMISARNGVDVDFVLSDCTPDEFEPLMQQVEENLTDIFEVQFGSLENGDRLYDLREEIDEWNYRNEHKRKPLFMQGLTDLADGAVPYHQFDYSVIDPDWHIILSIGGVPKWDNRCQVKDKRLNPSYSLSWDAYGLMDVHQVPVGSLSPFDRYREESAYARCNSSKADETRRLYELPIKNAEVLQKPQEIGERFNELPAHTQLLLVIRACSRGAMFEPNVILPEGKNSEGTYAISDRTKNIFQHIDYDALTKSVANLSEEEQRWFYDDLYKSLYSGLFYPKMIDYMIDTGIWRYFKGCQYIGEKKLLDLSKSLPSYNELARNYHRFFYRSLHFKGNENWPTDEESSIMMDTFFLPKIIGQKLAREYFSNRVHYTTALDFLFEFDLPSIPLTVSTQV
jgi:hypothetical protein